MAADTRTPQEKVFAHFIATKSILIVDSSGPCRVTIANMLISMGAKTAQIKLISQYEEALEKLRSEPVQILFSDYHLGKHCGIDLLEIQRERLQDDKNRIFVLATSNSSQSAVARAAEEEVDGYLVKPFTADVLKSALLRTILQKIQPSEYLQFIDKGKRALAEEQFDEALGAFEESKKLDQAPSLAFYYRARTLDLKKDDAMAEAEYNAGLAYNPMHYKCLTGLYEYFSARKRHEDAYSVMKRLTQSFPVSSTRLTSLLKLAVVTRNYDDVEHYYKIFTSIDDRNDEMVKYVCAALVICGKYFLQAGEQQKALDTFQKAAVTSGGKTKILREIIQALAENNLSDRAEDFLKRFTPAAQSGIDFLAMNYLIGSAMGTKTQTIERGRALVTRGYHDPVIYRVLIQASAEAGLKAATEDLLKKALDIYPKLESLFKEVAVIKKVEDPAAADTSDKTQTK